MLKIYDPSLHISLSCNDQDYLSALRLFESVCAPSIFPYVHQISRDALGQMQQKWFARCLQEILALNGDPHFFPVPINSCTFLPVLILLCLSILFPVLSPDLGGCHAFNSP